jgi:hypothetical protein
MRKMRLRKDRIACHLPPGHFVCMRSARDDARIEQLVRRDAAAAKTLRVPHCQLLAAAARALRAGGHS